MNRRTIAGIIAIIAVLAVATVSLYVLFADSDGDGWSNLQEKNAGTDPHNIDSDGDGIWDPHDPNPLVAYSAVPTEMPFTKPIPKTTTAIVSSVIDGDTVRLQTGESVRLLGINTPEMGQPFYDEASRRLKELLEGREVRLEADVEDEDRYGRLLRHIYAGSSLVNVEMVREGFANVYIIPPNTRYSSELEAAEEEARSSGRGIWQLSKGVSSCIAIAYFRWNAEENDCNNLNDEYVTFKNTCSEPIDMTGWTVKDEANHIYTFPSFSLMSGSTVTLYTGAGADTETLLYWDNRGGSCNAVWNNDGDTLYLRDLNGNLVLSHSYEGFD